MANLQRKNTGIAVLVLSIICFLFVLALSGMRADFLDRQAQVQRQEQYAFPESARVVFLGTSGVSWDFFTADTAPNLYAAALSQNAKTANFVVKVKADTACPDEGWLTLNTGVRTFGAAEGNQFCRSLPQIEYNNGSHEWMVTGWAAYLAANEHNKYDPQFGNLGRVLGLSEKKIAAIGAGAALALADTQGKLPANANYFSAQKLTESIALSENAQIILADLGSVREAASPLLDLENTSENSANAAAKTASRNNKSSDALIDPDSRNAGAASFNIPNQPTAQMRSDLRKLDANFVDLVQELKSQDLEFVKRTGEQRETKIVFASLAESGRSGAKMQAYFEADLADLSGEKLDARDFTQEAAGADALGDKAYAKQFSALAYTNSTRIPGLVQNTDLLPALAMFTLGNMQDAQSSQELQDTKTLQRDFTQELGNAVGAPITHYAQIVSPQNALAMITAQAERAQYVRASIGYVFIGYSVFSIIGLIVSVILLRCTYRDEKLQRLVTPKKIGFLQLFLLSLGALPLASFLVNLLPWWDFPFPRILSLLLIMVFAGGIGIAALAFPRAFSRWKGFCAADSRLAATTSDAVILRPAMAGAAFIALLTALTLAFDAALGSALQFSSIFGVQAQHAGRFYGFGNSAFVIFALSMLIITAYGMYLMRRANVPVWQIFTFGLLALVFAVYVDGAPIMGADFGGPPALVLAFMVLIMLNFGRNLGRRMLLFLLCFGLLAAAGIAVFDWYNPKGQRTHLGAFIESVLNGDLFLVVSRKFGEMFTDISPVVWGIVALVLCLFFWLLRRRRGLRRFVLSNDLCFDGKVLFPANMLSCQAAIAALLCFALVINDSGLLLPFIGLIYGLPLACVIAVEGYFLDSKRNQT